MLSIRRLAAGSTVLLLVFAAAAPAVAACAGWSMAPGDRHTCCAHLGDLASGESVTDCCAASEQSNAPADRDSQGLSVVRPAAPPAGVLLVPPPQTRLWPDDRWPLQAVSPPKYLLLASFLI